jgi:hypothetical protein
MGGKRGAGPAVRFWTLDCARGAMGGALVVSGFCRSARPGCAARETRQRSRSVWRAANAITVSRIAVPSTMDNISDGVKEKDVN